MHIVHVDRQRSSTGQVKRGLSVARAARARGHRVGVIAHPDAKLAWLGRAAGCEVLELPMRGWQLYPSALRAARVLRGQRVDILHCHGGRDQKLALALARLAGIPHVIRTKHNHTPPRSRRGVRGYRSCTKLIAVSEWVRGFMLESGLPEEQVVTIPDGIDVERFTPRPRDPMLARSLGIGPEDLVIGNVSSLHERKGIDDLLRCYARLRQTPLGGRLKCLLAGKQIERWQPLVRELGVEDGVLFPGFRDDVPEILSLLDVYVLMSRREALGTSVLEALAMERPVVASDVGGLTESLGDGTGMLCRPGDVAGLTAAVGGLLSEPERAQRLGRAGRQRVLAHYTDALLFERTLALYESVIEKAATPA